MNKNSPEPAVAKINFSPVGKFSQDEVDSGLVGKIFKALNTGKNVKLSASEIGSAHIIAAVIHHLVPLPLSVSVVCEISDMVGFNISATAPFTHIDLDYWYEMNGDSLSYHSHAFSKFQTPPFSGKGIKSLIESSIMNPEIAIASSLNHRAKHLRVDGGVEAVILGIAISPGRSTVTLIKPV
jgi:hypothetical protein